MKQYAFWRYDTYPYFLGGEVTRMNDQGLVETVNYGRGHWFKPVLIVPLKAGLIIQQGLRKLEDEHRQAHEELRSKFVAKLEQSFPDLAKHRK